MKNYFKNLFVLLLIFFFTSTVFEGIQMPDITIYAILTLIILATGIMITKPLLKFLTIKTNFLTHILMSSLITIGIVFLLKIFMTGFTVVSTQFSGINIGFLQINDFELSPVLTIIVFSVVSCFMSSIFYLIDESD